MSDTFTAVGIAVIFTARCATFSCTHSKTLVQHLPLAVSEELHINSTNLLVIFAELVEL